MNNEEITKFIEETSYSRRVTENEVKRMIEMYEAGRTLDDIQRIVKVSKPTIVKHLKRKGIKLLTKKDRWKLKNFFVKQKLAKLVRYNRNITDVKIAEILGKTTVTVRRLRKELEAEGLIEKVSKGERHRKTVNGEPDNPDRVSKDE